MPFHETTQEADIDSSDDWFLSDTDENSIKNSPTGVEITTHAALPAFSFIITDVHMGPYMVSNYRLRVIILVSTFRNLFDL